jgi:hypothetical protein
MFILQYTLNIHIQIIEIYFRTIIQADKTIQIRIYSNIRWLRAKDSRNVSLFDINSVCTLELKLL